MSPKEKLWLTEYFKSFNATDAARRVGYKWPDKQGAQKKEKFADLIAAELDTRVMSADEAARRMADAARFDMSPYLIVEGKSSRLDIEKLKADGYGWVVRGLKYTSKGGPIYETWDSQRALEKIYDNVNPSLGDERRPITIKIVDDR
jgi:Terminase small subunit